MRTSQPEVETRVVGRQLEQRLMCEYLFMRDPIDWLQMATASDEYLMGGR